MRIQVVLLMLLCGTSYVFAQGARTTSSTSQREISARVVDKSGQPVVGATVLNKADGKWTVSDENGYFSIVPDQTNEIVVSFIEFKTVTVNCGSVNDKDIVLEEDILRLDESVVTGYTTQKKADLTGAVSVINVDQVMRGSAGNAMRATQGRVAGMAITTSGSPIPGATVRIRGEGTLNDNNPLYIIDGMPTTRSMGELSSLDIESIQVLKDASSASIYGSRAANGLSPEEYRKSLTLPRELKLARDGKNFVLVQNPVVDFESHLEFRYGKEGRKLNDGDSLVVDIPEADGTNVIRLAFDNKDHFAFWRAERFGIRLVNGDGETVTVSYDSRGEYYLLDRGGLSSEIIGASPNKEMGAMYANLEKSSDWTIVRDGGAIEFFADGGKVAMTAICPTVSDFDHLVIFADKGSVTCEKLEIGVVKR